MTTLTTISSRMDSTTAALTELATPVGPPAVDNPFWQDTTATMAPKITAFTSATTMSPVVAKEANVATKLPGAPFWKYTLNRKLARKPTKHTTPVSATPIMTAAANLGT